MDNIIIRKCEKKDEKEILNICYSTGYMGEEMKSTNEFNDVELFGYIFCYYYIWYEIHTAPSVRVVVRAANRKGRFP